MTRNHFWGHFWPKISKKLLRFWENSGLFICFWDDKFNGIQLNSCKWAKAIFGQKWPKISKFWPIFLSDFNKIGVYLCFWDDTFIGIQWSSCKWPETIFGKKWIFLTFWPFSDFYKIGDYLYAFWDDKFELESIKIHLNHQKLFLGHILAKNYNVYIYFHQFFSYFNNHRSIYMFFEW